MTPEKSEPNSRQVQEAETLDEVNALYGDPREAQKVRSSWEQGQESRMGEG